MLNLVMIRRRHWSTGQQTSMGATPSMSRGLCVWPWPLIKRGLHRLSHSAAGGRDMTAEQVFSLSPTTRDVLEKIKPEHPDADSSLRLDRGAPRLRSRSCAADRIAARQYAQIAGSKMDVQYIDVEPFSKEAEEAKTLGIAPERVRSEREGRHYEETIYLGAVISSSYDQVVIPFFGAGLPLEYELTRSIQTVAKENRKTVGVLKTDSDVIGGSHDWQIVTELKQQYNVKEVSPDTPIEDGKYDVLLAVMPSSLTDPQMKNLVAYVKKGRPTLIFDDPFPWVFNSAFGVSQRARLEQAGTGRSVRHDGRHATTGSAESRRRQSDEPAQRFAHRLGQRARGLGRLQSAPRIRNSSGGIHLHFAEESHAGSIRHQQ